jgi:Cd2+/Zn2+-exporting ATPase/Cu+-exporting ATPase
VLEAAASAERPSEHPLAKAVLAEAGALSVSVAEPETFDYTPGQGVVCSVAGEEIVVGNRSLLAGRGIHVEQLASRRDGFSVVLVARDGQLLGAIDLTDVLRPEAVSAVQALRALGIRTALVSGDRTAIATAIGTELGVDQVDAELLPEQKLTRVRGLLAQGKTVAMIGDGINDAPALMQASVGVAMGSGTDLARESAHVMLLGDDLLRFVGALRIARRCRRIILQNFAGTLLVDGTGMALAAAGLLNPLLAAFIHVASELGFILNSARLLPQGDG